MTKRNAKYLGILAGAALIGAVVGFLAPSTKAQPTVSAPAITVTTGVTTGAAVQIIGFNPTRRSIQICTFTNSIIIAPVNTGSLTPVVPSATQGINVPVNTCFVPPAPLTASGTSGGVSAAWQAIGGSGTASVSVLEY